MKNLKKYVFQKRQGSKLRHVPQAMLCKNNDLSMA